MIGRDTLGSSLGAVMTGVAVTSGPWLLTTALLVLMRISAVLAGVSEITAAERVITVAYAVVIVLSAPIDIVLTRFSADCVYERRCERIAAPLSRTLCFSLFVFAVIGALAMHIASVPLRLAVPGTILATVVGAQWLLLSAAGGLSSPGIILRAFAYGAPVSVIAWAGIVRPLELGPLGYLIGFGAGQLVTLGFLMWGTFRALPEREDPSASMTAATRKYSVLALSALVFSAGLWVDKLIVWLMAGEALASQYAALAALAWLSIVPACAYLFVVVETTFHRRFHSFFGGLQAGSPLDELEVRDSALRGQVRATLWSTAGVQLSFLLVCLVAAPAIVPALQLTGAPPTTIGWLLLGSSLQAIAFCALLLLYYFDFQLQALLTSTVQLVSNTVLTVWIGPSEHLGLGYAMACAATAFVAIRLLLGRMPHLLADTLQSQPELAER